MTLGFVRAGFTPTFAVEIDPSAAKTYSVNFGCHVYNGPVEEVDDFGKAPLLIGGPPCQGFSPLGRKGDHDSRESRNLLWQEFVRAVRQVRPAVFVMENVPQFLRSTQFEDFRKLFTEETDFSDYRVEWKVLEATDYGVPQRRRRAIVIGSRIGPPPWPARSHGPNDLERSVATVRDAIADLPLAPDGENLHVARNPRSTSIERYRAVPEGGNRFDLARNRPDLLPSCWKNKATGTTDVFGRLWWDRPAYTIRTEFFKPEKGRYLHPVADRAITHREAARLQSFPDDFVFEGNLSKIAAQIGNAVPPLMAEAIAKAIQSAPGF
jgi:DNA (cytosine-5)-methyltransferase 1